MFIFTVDKQLVKTTISNVEQPKVIIQPSNNEPYKWWNGPIKSKKTFERLTYQGYEPASAEEWYIRRQRRDRQARDDYRKMSAEMRQKEDLYIMQIMDEEIGTDDARLR